MIERNYARCRNNEVHSHYGPRHTLRLQQQQVSELLHVVAIAHAVVAQHVAVVPEFLDDGGGVHDDAIGANAPSLARSGLPDPVRFSSAEIIVAPYKP